MVDDSNIYTAVRAWLSNATAAEAAYGHISTWGTSGVTSMSYLFDGASSFNQDISTWSVDNVRDMHRMFSGASLFNQDLSNWRVDKVTDMSWMFGGASAFDQDLGWCVDDDVNLEETFMGTKCEFKSCGVKKEVFGTCDEGAIAGYSILIALSCLLFLLAAYVRCKKKKDETYAAAARRVLCRRGTKVRAVAPTTSEEAPALPASTVRVVDAEGIAPNELGTVVSVEQPPANQR